MKSKFFKDTHNLDSALEAYSPDKLNVCLRLDKRVYEHVVVEAQRLGISSGEYLEKVLRHDLAAERTIH